MALSLVLIALLSFSCKKPVGQIGLEVATREIGKSCPVQLGASMTWDSVEYHRNFNEVTFYYTIEQSETSLDLPDFIRKQDENLIKNTLCNTLQQDTASRKFLHLMEAAECTFNVEYYFNNQMIRRVSLTKEEYAKEKKTEDMQEEDFEKMKNEVQLVNQQLPVMLDEVTTLTKCELDLDDRTLKYTYTLDDSQIEINDDMTSIFRSNILSIISSGTMIVYKRNDFSLLYDYYNPNGELIFHFTIQPSEY